MITAKNNTRGFTLIELLVVITIIGILATGAVSVFTSQIQKARDTTRINDVKALQGGVEQMYQTDQKYPDITNFTGIVTFVPKIPADPKTGEATATTSFDYSYNQAKDTNGIEGQFYEISTGFEAQANLTSKAGSGADKWEDDNRFEIGVSMDTVATKIKGSQKSNAKFACITTDDAAVNATCSTWAVPTSTAILVK